MRESARVAESIKRDASPGRLGAIPASYAQHSVDGENGLPYLRRSRNSDLCLDSNLNARVDFGSDRTPVDGANLRDSERPRSGRAVFHDARCSGWRHQEILGRSTQRGGRSWASVPRSALLKDSPRDAIRSDSMFRRYAIASVEEARGNQEGESLCGDSDGRGAERDRIHSRSVSATDTHREKRGCFRRELAGRQGLEPRFTGPEPVVLPLNDLPVARGRRIIGEGRAAVKSACPAGRWRFRCRAGSMGTATKS